MPHIDSIERYLWYVTIAGQAMLYFRLWRTGLRHTYKFFSMYVLFCLVRSLLLESLSIVFPASRAQSNLYAQVWMATEPVLWILYVLVVLELYSLVFQQYKGIASLGRWVVLAGLAIAVVLSSVSLSVDLSNPGEQFPILRYFFAISRGVFSSLVVFLLCITGFLVWCPVPLNRNIVVHSIVYALYFLGFTATLLLRNLAGSAITEYASTAMLVVSLVCLTVWILVLDPSGEKRTVQLNHHWQAEREQHVIEQMAAINSTLMRAARK